VRLWRRVRDLASDLGDLRERDELDNRARIGMLAVAWRLGMAPEDSAAIHAESSATGEQLLLDLNYAATLMHSGRERAGLDLFRRVFRKGVDYGDPALAITPALGVSYAAWMAGSLREAVDVIDLALQLAGGDPRTGTGVAFVCPYAHTFAHRGQALGFMGELARAAGDFEMAVALARENDDPEVESYCHANRALLAACIGDINTALDAADQCRQIAERAGNAIALLAGSSGRAVAEAGAGRFSDALARSEANLVTLRRDRVGLYYEPLLLVTIGSCQLEFGKPVEALAACEEAVRVMEVRGLTTCALPAPIGLAKVLIATQGAAAGERIDAILTGALRVVGQSEARVFEPQIREQRAALARLRGDDLTAQREEAEAERLIAASLSGMAKGGPFSRSIYSS
jgi:tetratricopeptide (TPR) repeat protein